MMRIFFLMWMCWLGVASASISVEVTPKKVHFGASFRLTFKTDATTGDIPNLIPLQQDFMLMGTERTMSYRVINGQTTSETLWTIILSPKKVGILYIPAISFGPQQSMPAKIEVLGASSNDLTNDTQQHDGVEIETSVSSQKPFVNQQVLYTVKIYHHQQLMDASYKPPEVEDALMVPLGEAKRYQDDLNGNQYAVEEQKYVIFPQKKGPLTIHSPSLNALVMDTIPERLNARAKDSTLEVQPIPKEEKASSWLPAERVSLTETYDKSEKQLEKGSTLTRTITLQAQGLPAQLLPSLSVENAPQFNVYLDKPTLKNKVGEHALIGRMEVKATYVLNHAGHVILPRIQVPWFNTVTGKKEVATLPEQLIIVDAKAGSTSLKPKTFLPKAKESKSPMIAKPPSYVWMIWVLGLFFCISLFFILKYATRTYVKKRKAFKMFQKACLQNRAEDAKIALLAWARLKWPEKEWFDVQHPIFFRDATLKKHLMKLSEVVYGKASHPHWQGKELLSAMKAFARKKTIKKSKAKDVLPPIYL